MPRLPEVTERDRARAQTWLLKHGRPERPAVWAVATYVSVRRARRALPAVVGR